MSDMALKDLELPPTLTSSATEVDITDYHRQPSAYTQINEALLAGDAHIEPNEDSASVCTRSTLATHERPVSLASENAVYVTDAPVKVPATNPRPIRLELGEPESSRTTIERVPTTSNHHEFLQVPTSSRQGVSEDDIELEDFALISARTHSTNHLVPPPGDEPKPQDHPHNSGSPDRVDPKPPPRANPNYKPPSLRWPFQLFLVAIIAGMFAFLEYQVHNLPPPHYQALQLGLKEGSDARNTLAVTGMATFRPTITPAFQARPLPKSPDVAPTRTHEDSYIRLMIPAPTPRPSSSEYPNPTWLVTAYCGWHRPRWLQDGFVVHQKDWSSDSTFLNIKEQISVFTTTDLSWCPCTISKGGFGPFPASWDTNDEGCRSVFNLISTINTPGYKIHVWHQPSTAPYQRAQIVTEPPPSIAVPWGYPSINPNGEVMLPLEVRTPKFELRDVFGRQLADRNAPATFPVSYRWPADEIGFVKFNEEFDDPDQFPFSSAYLAGPTTPCVTDIREVDVLLYMSLFDVTVGACPDKVESYKTTWWTLPYGRPLLSNTSTTEAALATPSTASTKPSEDGTSANHVQPTSTFILPNPSPLTLCLLWKSVLSLRRRPSRCPLLPLECHQSQNPRRRPVKATPATTQNRAKLTATIHPLSIPF